MLPSKFTVAPAKTVTVLFEAAVPVLKLPLLVNVAFEIVRLLNAAPLVPTFTPAAMSCAPFRIVTELLVAAPLPMVNVPRLVQTELLPVTNTCWLLQPLPTV